MKLQPLAVALSRAVVDSMTACGIVQEDFLEGPIKHTDLSWQLPPLHCEAPLFKLPLNQYFERPITVVPERLLNLWTDALLNMRNKPHAVLNLEGFKSLSYALPRCSPADRRICLSVPEGYPVSIGDLAGVTLSMEVAHLFRFNARIIDFISDDNNYYAVLPNDYEVGVKDGLPTVAGDEWDLPVLGMLPEMLASGRGTPFEGCDYDIIAKTRSLIEQHRKELPEAEGLDWAVQALRALNGQPQLLKVIGRVKQGAFLRKRRLEIVKQAQEVAYRFALSDRARIVTLRGLLVPDVLTPTEFTHRVYSYSATPPAIVHPKVILRLREATDNLVKEEEDRYAIKN